MTIVKITPLAVDYYKSIARVLSDLPTNIFRDSQGSWHVVFISDDPSREAIFLETKLGGWATVEFLEPVPRPLAK